MQADMDLTQYLNQFSVSTEIKMWIQSSLALGMDLNELLEVAKSHTNIYGEVPNTIELIIATSRINGLAFRYGSQNYAIRNGHLMMKKDDNEED